MDIEPAVVPDKDAPIFTNPWPALYVGMAATGLAFIAQLLGGASVPLAVDLQLLLVGLAGTIAAVAIAPQSAAVLGCAAGVCFVDAVFAHSAKWDNSATLLFNLGGLVAAFGAVVVLLPPAGRRLAVSLVILFHFGGILTAVIAAPPQSWVADTIWKVVYRPYLQFMHLNNAYHFYSPEPGPATLIWYRIEYEPDPDGTRYTRWIKVPDLDENGRSVEQDALEHEHRILKVEFTRRLSLNENASGPAGIPANIGFLRDARQLRGNLDRIPMMDSHIRPIDFQYREPSMLAKYWLSCYVKQVARTYKHRDRPDKKVVNVKVYRVLHEFLTAEMFARGHRLDAPWTYYPYFMGDFDADGRLKSRVVSFDEKGNMRDDYRDPYLYWLIPIIPKNNLPVPLDPRDDNVVDNYLAKHAGDTSEERQP